MIKGVVRDKKSRRKTVLIGLSFANLEQFRARPLDTYIKIDGKVLGIPFDILLMSGETEAQMEALLRGDLPGDNAANIAEAKH